MSDASRDIDRTRVVYPRSTSSVLLYHIDRIVPLAERIMAEIRESRIQSYDEALIEAM